MQSPTGNSQPGSMPVGARLRNAPVSVLPAHAREKIVAHSLARQYTSKVLARAVIRQARQAAIRQARQAAQGLLHEIYQDMVEDVADKEELEKLERTSWQDKLEKLRQFARALPERRIRYVPASLPGGQSLPAALLADHRSHLLRMPLLRLMSGKEIVVEIPRHCSTHDFLSTCARRPEPGAEHLVGPRARGAREFRGSTAPLRQGGVEWSYQAASFSGSNARVEPGGLPASDVLCGRAALGQAV